MADFSDRRSVAGDRNRFNVVVRGYTPKNMKARKGRGGGGDKRRDTVMSCAQQRRAQAEREARQTNRHADRLIRQTHREAECMRVPDGVAP